MPPDQNQALAVGTLLDGKFRVTKEIGRGGMAVVYQAENVDIGKRVAVKVLAAELVSSRTVTERFIREARAAAAIRSPHICDVYDVGTFDDRPFLVMELLEGESLYDRLSRVRKLDIPTTLLVCTQICKGLVKAHDGNIVHRDLKPENIFLTSDEDGRVVTKIVDFGLAKFYEPTLEGGKAARLTKEGALFGTPAYMSPEQAKAQGEVDHRADLWALACIVYECLTGRTVWNVDQGVAMILAQIAGAPVPRPSRIRSDLPKSFDDWFIRALDRNPDRRFQTAREFADSLAAALAPPEGSIKETPLHTAEEGQDVDRLVSGGLEAPPPPAKAPGSPAPGPREGESAARHAATDDGAELRPSVAPPEHTRGPGVAIGVLLSASALALGGYGAWFYVLNPDTREDVAQAIGHGPAPGSSAGSSRELAETEPFALQIATAQERLSRGEVEVAVQLFKGAFEASQQNNAARSLYNHAEVAAENTATAPCKIMGLGRPRPFDGRSDAPLPASIAQAPGGSLVTWSEMVPSSRKRHGLLTTLDPALRRVSPVTDVTPEARQVQQTTLEPLDEGFALLYWDTAPAAPQVFLRKLDERGTIQGAPVEVSPGTEKQSLPAITREPGGRVWVAWTEKTSARVSDLLVRSFDEGLKPTAAPGRITRHVAPARASTTASRAALALAHGYLNVAYTLERGVEFHVFALRVPLIDPLLSSGGLPAPPAGADDTTDRFLGQMVPVSAGPGQHNQPAIACTEHGCFVAWDDERAGAHVAFLAAADGAVVWRRDLGEKALSPALAVSGSQVALAWYDGGRVRLAPVNREGVAEPTLIGRIGGYQRAPRLIAGTKTGEWLLAWRDFEAGQHEAFVARAECR